MDLFNIDWNSRIICEVAKMNFKDTAFIIIHVLTYSLTDI
jgi:hypothetical protein